MLVLFLFTFFSHLSFGQANLTIDTKVSGDVIICSNEVTFTVYLENVSSTNLSSLKLYPNMPQGMVYVLGSAVGMQEAVGCTAENPSFVLSNLIAGSLPFSVSFRAKATCKLIDYISTRQADIPTLVNNNTKVTCVKDGSPLEILEPNGSDSYNVLYPVLELKLNPAFPGDISLDPLHYKDFQKRHFQIKNTGTADLKELYLKITDHKEIKRKSLTLTDETGNTTIYTLSNATYEAATNTYTYKLTQFNNGKSTLSPGEVIYLTDEAQVDGVNAAAETQYSALWGDAAQKCNINDQTSALAVYIHSPTGSPNVPFFDMQLPAPTNEVVTKTTTFSIGNTGSGSSSRYDAMYNIQLYYSVPIRYEVETFLKTGDKLIKLSATERVEGSESSSFYYDLSQFKTDPDGNSGLSDLDGLGSFNDLDVNQSFEIVTQYKVKEPYVLDLCPDKDFSDYFYVTVLYQNWNGDQLSKFMGDWAYKYLNRFFVNRHELTGSTDLNDGEVGTLNYNVDAAFTSYDFDLSNARTKYKLKLPEGYILKEALNSVANKATPFYKENEFYIISYDSWYTPSLKLTVEKHCSNVTESLETASIESYYYFDKNNSNNYLRFGCASFDIYNHCQICNGLKTTSFTAERSTLGWKYVYDNSHFYTYDELFGPDSEKNKVNPSENKYLNLNAVYPLDVVKTSLKGTITADTYHGLHAKITYESPVAGKELFQLKDGRFILGEKVYMLKTGYEPVISFEGKTYTIDVDISSAVETPVPEITGSFELIVNLITKDIPGLKRGQYPVNHFRGQFYGVNSKSVSTTCIGYGVNFYFLKPEPSIPTDFFVGYSCDNMVNIMNPISNANSKDSYLDFYDEIRFQSIIKSFTVQLPDGFVFNKENRAVYFTNFETTLFQIDPNDLEFSVDNKTLTYTLHNNSKIPFVAHQYGGFTVKASIIPDEKFEPSSQGFTLYRLQSTINIMGYAYAENPVFSQGAQVTRMMIHSSPDLQLAANKIQEGISKTVNWPIHLCNNSDPSTYISKPTNSWVAVELDPADNTTVLGLPKDESGNLLPTVRYSYYNIVNKENRAILIQFGDIEPNTCKTINLEATYKNCLDNLSQDMNLLGSWMCKNPVTVTPSTKTVVDLRDKQIALLQDKLSIRYRTSDMQWAVNFSGAERVALCEPMPFEIDLTSTKPASMNSLMLTAELPPATSVATETGEFEPFYVYNGVRKPLSLGALNGNKLNIDVSSLLPKGELPGTESTEANNIKVGISVTPNGGTGYDAGIPVKFNLSAKTNCQTEKIFDDQHKIRLTGMTLDDIALDISATEYQSCSYPDNTNLVSVVLSNKLPTFSQSRTLEVYLSNNIQFESLVSGVTGPPTVVKGSDDPSDDLENVSKIIFELPDRLIEPNGSKVITFSTSVKGESEEGGVAYLSARTLMSAEVYSQCDGQNKAVMATTGSTDASFELYNIFPRLELKGSNKVNPVCKNTRLRLKAELGENQYPDDFEFEWLVNDQPSQKTQTLTLSPQSDVDVKVSVKSAFGCISKDETYIAVLKRENPVRQVDIKASFDCSVPSGSLAVEHTVGNEYQWYKDGSIIPGAYEPTLDILQSGTYEVYVTNNLCGSVSEELPVNLNTSDNNLKISIKPTFVEAGYNIRAKVEPWKPGTVYTWSWGDNSGKSTLSKNIYHTYSQPGNFEVKVNSKSMFGCASSANTKTIEVVKSLCATAVPANSPGAFYLDNQSGRYVFRDNCSTEIDFGCISGQSNPTFLKRAVNASAVTYSDQWNYNDDDLNATGKIPGRANVYDSGKAGKWRPNASFVYYNNLNQGTVNSEAGTFTMESFNYKFEDSNNPSRWIRTNSSEYYGPNGNLLQQRDPLGIPSSEKYGYNKTVVYVSALNVEQNDLLFESFENVYEFNSDQYFEDNMKFNSSEISIDSKISHSGKQSVMLNNSSGVLSTREFNFSNQIIDNGIQINCWIRVSHPDAENIINANMVGKLLNEVGTEIVTSPFKIIAHVGDWFLVESVFKKMDEMKEGNSFIPTIYLATDKKVNIDDLRIQPLNAKSTAYVFDPETFKVLTVFNEQLFGLYYQYDQEGKLIRKQIETEKGKKTVQETFYNLPKTDNPNL
jgi:hypothetical protein